MHIASLLRYPVKSMLGEAVTQSAIGTDGLEGDRRLAVVAQRSGLVASAKHPSKWGKLLRCHAVGGNSTVTIMLPGLRVARSDDDDVDDALSEYCGQPVRLTSLPPPDPHLEREWPDIAGLAPPEAIVRAGTVTPMASAAPATFFDYAPVHIVTTSTLAALRKGGPKSGFDARRFRPNIIVSTPHEGFVENTWAGKSLSVGTAVVEVLTPTPRCAVPALAHGELPADPDVLRTVVARNRIDIGRGLFACVGVYGRVLRPGHASVGDDAEFG